MQALLQGLIPVVVGALVSLVTGALKKFLPWFDNLSGLLKSVAVVVLAFLAAQVQMLIGVPVPGDLHGWSADVLTTILTALSAMGLRAIYKGAAPAAK